MSKQQVKLIFQKDFLEYPTIKDAFPEVITVELPTDFESVHLVAARVYEPEDAVTSHPSGDSNACIWNYQDEQRLVGKLLTYVDATYADPEQRKAHKDIVKELVYGYCQELRTRGIQTVDAYANGRPK